MINNKEKAGYLTNWFELNSDSLSDLSQPPEKKNCLAEPKTSPIQEEELKKQNKEFFEIRAKLKVNTKKEDRIAMLTFNEQFIPEGNSEVWWKPCKTLRYD